MAAKRKAFCKKETMYNETDAGRMAYGARFKFANGETIEVRNDAMPEAIQAEATAHGLKQKLGDSYNKAVTVGEAIDTFNQYLGRLANGDWNAERTGFGISDEFIIKAIARLKGKEPDEIQVTWDALSDERQDALRKDERIKAEAEKVRAEEKADKATESDQLAEF